MSVEEAQLMSQISERLAVVIEQTKHTATKEDLGAVKNEILQMLISHQQATFGWIMGAYGLVIASVIVNHVWK
jgi:hypothetical protein